MNTVLINHYPKKTPIIPLITSCSKKDEIHFFLKNKQEHIGFDTLKDCSSQIKKDECMGWHLLMTTPWHSLPHHPSIKPTLFHSLSTLIQHALAWGHSAIVPTSLFWDCVAGTLPAGPLTEAYKFDCDWKTKQRKRNRKRRRIQEGDWALILLNSSLGTKPKRASVLLIFCILDVLSLLFEFFINCFAHTNTNACSYCSTNHSTNNNEEDHWTETSTRDSEHKLLEKTVKQKKKWNQKQN